MNCFLNQGTGMAVMIGLILSLLTLNAASAPSCAASPWPEQENQSQFTNAQSIFNLEGMATICQILTKPGVNLWDTVLSDGRSMLRAIEFLFPYLKDRSSWPHARDVAYFEDYPVRHQFLLFAATAFEKPAYLELWKTLDPDPVVPEVIRSMPLRQPVLWFD